MQIVAAIASAKYFSVCSKLSESRISTLTQEQQKLEDENARIVCELGELSKSDCGIDQGLEVLDLMHRHEVVQEILNELKLCKSCALHSCCETVLMRNQIVHLFQRGRIGDVILKCLKFGDA